MIDADGDPYPLLALSDTDFYMTRAGVQIRFAPDAAGMVDAMEVVVSGKAQRAPKVR